MVPVSNAFPSRTRKLSLLAPQQPCAAGGPRAGADGTARVTVWESRKSPELFKEARSVEKPQRAFCCAVEDPAEQQDSFDEFQLSQTDSNCLASQLKLPRDIQ